MALLWFVATVFAHFIRVCFSDTISHDVLYTLQDMSLTYSGAYAHCATLGDPWMAGLSEQSVLTDLCKRASSFGHRCWTNDKPCQYYSADTKQTGIDCSLMLPVVCVSHIQLDPYQPVPNHVSTSKQITLRHTLHTDAKSQIDASSKCAQEGGSLGNHDLSEVRQLALFAQSMAWVAPDDRPRLRLFFGGGCTAYSDASGAAFQRCDESLPFVCSKRL